MYRFDFVSPTFHDSGMNLSDISATQLRQAASIKEQIEKLQKELMRILGTATPAATAPAAPKKKMSPAAKAALSAKLKEIWAKRKAGKQPATVVQKPKARRKMSAAAKAAISKAAKARWAKFRAAKK